MIRYIDRRYHTSISVHFELYYISISITNIDWIFNDNKLDLCSQHLLMKILLFNFSFISINNVLNEWNRCIYTCYVWKKNSSNCLVMKYFFKFKILIFLKSEKKISLKVFIKHNHISHQIFYNKSFFRRKLNIKLILKKKKKNHNFFSYYFHFSSKKMLGNFNDGIFFNMNL